MKRERRTSFSPLMIPGVIIVLIAGWSIASYNSLVNLEENADNAFAKIEAQYQRRFDLLPNVIRTVKGVSTFEQKTLQGIVEARSAWTNSDTKNEQVEAAHGLDSAISRLVMTVEGYPDIKSSEAYRDLITELEGTENRIAFARNRFNDIATQYNKYTRHFPQNFVAKFFGFNLERKVFEAQEGTEIVPIVDFGNNQ